MIQIAINIDGELEGSFSDVMKLGQDIRKSLETVLKNRVHNPIITIQRVNDSEAVNL